MAGFFDYGPLGVELKNNIKKLWWREMVQKREDIVGLDSSIISSPLIWQASGHVGGFSDPMVDCRSSMLRFRADQVFWAPLETEAGEVVTYVSVIESEVMHAEATKAALKKAKTLGKTGPFKPLELKDLTEATADIYDKIPSPATGEPGTMTFPRDFNLMFQTNVGAVQEESSVAYLRPETAQVRFTYNLLSSLTRLIGRSLSKGNIYEFCQRPAHCAYENTVRYRAGRQGLSQRNHPS